MDSYDAIREQLRSAQTRAQETLKQRLESVISALEDAKAAVRQTTAEAPDELFSLGEVQAAVDELDVPQPEPVPAGITLELIRGLDAARSQSDLLHQLMTVLTDHASRAAVLVIRGQTVTAWSGVGFASDADLQGWHGEVDASEALDRLVREAAPIRFSPAADPLLGDWLGGEEAAGDALLVPVSLRGKLMGAVYADSVGGGPWDPAMVQALVAVSCWLIDTLHHRTAAPSPMVAAPLDVTAGMAPPEPQAPEPELEQEPAEDRVEEAVVAQAEARELLEEVAPEEQEAEEEAALADELEYADELEFPEEPELPESAAVPEEPELEVAATAEIGDAEFDPSATVQVELGEVEVAPPEAEEMDVETASEVSQGEVGGEVAWQPPPAAEGPPPVKPIEPPPDLAEPAAEVVAEAASQLSPEEETRHEEARRFARLLVSEIKLYNERDVEKGREGRDLYQRLKEDIDRSREMYEKRIAPDVRAARDYFHEELVRILADGNPDALGM